MEDSQKAALVTILILVVIALGTLVVGIAVSDFFTNDKVLEKNITVMGKICGEKTWGSTKSSIQSSDFVVYGTTNADCQRYEVGGNYTIQYNNIRSSLSGIDYNLIVGV